MMVRAATVILLYALIGTAFTVAGYRVAEGEAHLPMDGSVAFISILLNIALAFASAAVLLTLMAPSGFSTGLAMLVSALVAGVIGFGMMAWFPGLTFSFPLVMAAGGVVCAQTASALGLFNPPGKQ